MKAFSVFLALAVAEVHTSLRGDKREGERWRGAPGSDGEDGTVVEDSRS